MPRGAARQLARSSSPDRRKRAGRTRLRREIVAREWRPHLAAGEQQGHDDLDRRAAAETLAADGRARRLAAGAVQLDEEVGGAVDHARLVVEAGHRVHKSEHVHDLLDAVELPPRVLPRPPPPEPPPTAPP